MKQRSSVSDPPDWAKRARLAILGFTNMLNPKLRFELYPFASASCATPWLAHYKNNADLNAKIAEALPLLRTISGSGERIEHDYGLMNAMLADLGEDGLCYARCRPDRPWHEGGAYHPCEARGEDFASVLGNARLVMALLNWHAYDGEARWADAARRVARGLASIAIRRGDVAFYPNGGIGMAFCYPRSGWLDAAEPTSDRWGGEGTAMVYYGPVLRGLTRYLRESGDQSVADVCHRLARFMMDPRFWGCEAHDATGGEKPVGTPWVAPNDPHHLEFAPERGHFSGHFHGKLAGLRGLLEYALYVQDERIAQFVRDGYEFARHRGVPAVGCFGDHCWLGTTEGCTVADMLNLALSLSRAGIGDYWDDAERISRNHLIEQQLTSVDALERVAAADHSGSPWGAFMDALRNGGTHAGQTVLGREALERMVGCWATFASPNALPHPYVTMCCSGNCGQALHAAWASALVDKEGVLTVNAWVDRDCDDIRVSSALPQEGRVDLLVRRSRTLAVRVPGWAKEGHVQCRGADPLRVGRLLIFPQVAAGTALSVTAALETREESHTMPFAGPFKMTFRGHTCIHVAPRCLRPTDIPLYQRDGLRPGEGLQGAGKEEREIRA